MKKNGNNGNKLASEYLRSDLAQAAGLGSVETVFLDLQKYNYQSRQETVSLERYYLL